MSYVIEDSFYKYCTFYSVLPIPNLPFSLQKHWSDKGLLESKSFVCGKEAFEENPKSATAVDNPEQRYKITSNF